MSTCQHTVPCKECPWRRKACPGWLGSDYSRDKWLHVAHGDDAVECHKSSKHDCAGMAIFRANVYKRPREGLILPKDHALVFSNDAEFKAHHEKLGVISSEPEFRK